MKIEFQILDFIQGIRTPLGDSIMKIITSLGNAGIIWILLAIVLLIIPKMRKVGLMLTIALILDLLVCNVLLKNIFARTRPYDINTAIELFITRPSDFSFPSGHTAASAVACTVLYLNKQKILWKAATVLTICIAFSRMYFYVHYPTDIIGGAIIGIAIGYIGFQIVNIFQKKYQKSCSIK